MTYLAGWLRRTLGAIPGRFVVICDVRRRHCLTMILRATITRWIPSSYPVLPVAETLWGWRVTLPGRCVHLPAPKGAAESYETNQRARRQLTVTSENTVNRWQHQLEPAGVSSLTTSEK